MKPAFHHGKGFLLARKKYPEVAHKFHKQDNKQYVLLIVYLFWNVLNIWNLKLLTCFHPIGQKYLFNITFIPCTNITDTLIIFLLHWYRYIFCITSSCCDNLQRAGVSQNKVTNAKILGLQNNLIISVAYSISLHSSTSKSQQCTKFVICSGIKDTQYKAVMSNLGIITNHRFATKSLIVDNVIDNTTQPGM